MKYSLTMVESPLQLLNAYEAMHFFKIKNARYLIRFSGVASNDLQIRKTLNILNVNRKHVYEVTIRAKARRFTDFIKMAFFMSCSVIMMPLVNKFYVGNYDSKFLSLIYKFYKNEKVVLLDDGNKTLRFQQGFSENYNYNLFTMFELKKYPSQNIYRNRFCAIKKLLKDELIIKDDYVIFLGSGLSEINIISDNYYIELLNEITIHYSMRDKSVLYIPHRSEDSAKLKIIQSISNLKIRHLSFPVELIGLFESEISNKISSFCSTALYSLREIYGVNVECFKFDYSQSNDKAELDELYQYYDDNKIEVLDLGV